MEDTLELARAKESKERMVGVERLLDFLKDANFRVSQGSLQALASAAMLSGEPLKLHFNVLVPAVVDRLGDAKQPVRDDARRLLHTLMEVHLRVYAHRFRGMELLGSADASFHFAEAWCRAQRFRRANAEVSMDSFQ